MRAIDAGKSRRGWSRIGVPIKCMYLAGAQKRGAWMGSRDPLLKGSIGHLGMAHLRLHEGVDYGPVMVNGEEVDVEGAEDFFQPIQAMQHLCRTDSEYAEFESLLCTILTNYFDERASSIGHAIMVEQELVGVVGTVAGEFGYWLVADDQWDLLEPERDADGYIITDSMPSTYKGFDGSIIKPTRIKLRGAKEDGNNIWLSRRLDAVLKKGKWGPIYAEDHKFKGRISSKSSVDGYRADDGFAAIDSLSRQRFGADFGGTIINMICTGKGLLGKEKRVLLTPARAAEKHLPYTLFAKEMDWARYQHWADIGALPYEVWPRSRAEVGTNCSTQYGLCSLNGHCNFGDPLVFD